MCFFAFLVKFTQSKPRQTLNKILVTLIVNDAFLLSQAYWPILALPNAQDLLDLISHVFTLSVKFSHSIPSKTLNKIIITGLVNFAFMISQPY